ncbi:hypothetical protein FSP39_001089 [Pinctada imbricata]|uniref:PdxS/SNZ N-terminal domain-containing protein n=1 Tax=Pinctada imbricata TaxID=66713 RepID=A0AA88YK31_PINIB|nr:hypothetical protein FSP39_001089 [Pinctada imbricata]
MAKGGIIMDVTNAEEARIAEEAGACAVMALERVPADIRRQGGVARMSDPKMIKEIMGAVTIPVMAKSRIGHFAEAQILEAIGVDMIDESEVLTPADEDNHIDKHNFKVPFVCGARDLGEALRRISEGAAMIRTKGEAGTATPADVSLLMQLGVDGVFVGSGIFKSSCPKKRAHAMAQAVTHYKDAKVLGELSSDLGEAMFGTPMSQRSKMAAINKEHPDKQQIWNATLGSKTQTVS